jgi:hypothetical protein
MYRKLQLALVVVSMVTVSHAIYPVRSAAAADNAIIEMTIGKIGFLVGVSRGDGRIFYNGRQADLEINGLRIGLTIGASFANMRGEVYNLNRLEDIAGTYVTAQASAVAISGGGQNLVLVNENGVRLVLWGEQQGLDASLDAGGMLISLK